MCCLVSNCMYIKLIPVVVFIKMYVFVVVCQVYDVVFGH
jgi:hypothetical protein